MTHKTDRCFDALYRCPWCGACYCAHKYNGNEFTWTCPNGAVLTLKVHLAGHAFQSTKET